MPFETPDAIRYVHLDPDMSPLVGMVQVSSRTSPEFGRPERLPLIAVAMLQAWRLTAVSAADQQEIEVAFASRMRTKTSVSKWPRSFSKSSYTYAHWNLRHCLMGLLSLTYPKKVNAKDETVVFAESV